MIALSNHPAFEWALSDRRHLSVTGQSPAINVNYEIILLLLIWSLILNYFLMSFFRFWWRLPPPRPGYSLTSVDTGLDCAHSLSEISEFVNHNFLGPAGPFITM